jgi:hypothetical protein
MSIWSRYLGSSAIAFALSGTLASAEVTAEQVWADLKAYLESFGYTVTADEQIAGDTITLGTLSLSMTMPEDSGSVTMSLDGMTFTETGDGSVSITLPERMPIAFTTITPNPEGTPEEISGSIDYTHSGFEMLVSGDPETMVYDYGAEEMALAMTSLTVAGQPQQITEARITFADVSGDSTSTGTDLRQIAQSMTAGAVAYVLDIPNPEDPAGQVSITGGLENLGYSGTLMVPQGIDMNDTALALQSGFGVDGSYSYENGSSDFAVSGLGNTMEGNTRSDSGRFTMNMNRDSIGYTAEASGLAINYSGTSVPLPVSLSMAEMGFNMLFPLAQTEEPTDFNLGLKLGDVVVSDTIWGLADPAGQLPRDPATLELDFTGKARLTQDIMDEEAMMNSAGTPPGEINSLSVNALNLAIAGAALTGSGNFTFDNADLSTFPGMPRPEGALDMQLTGGNALLDTLVAMGLLPEDQAMGARMMLGLFARPGSGPDTLTSRIEITPEGQVLANGQRLR